MNKKYDKINGHGKLFSGHTSNTKKVLKLFNAGKKRVERI